MLRIAVFGAGLGLLLGALVMAYRGSTGNSLELLTLGLACTGGVAFERWRYGRRHTSRPGPGWEATGERFVDPESGRLVEVYFETATGRRRYVDVDVGGVGAPER